MFSSAKCIITSIDQLVIRQTIRIIPKRDKHQFHQKRVVGPIRMPLPWDYSDNISLHVPDVYVGGGHHLYMQFVPTIEISTCHVLRPVSSSHLIRLYVDTGAASVIVVL